MADPFPERTWEPLNMTTAMWKEIPPSLVHVREIQFTHAIKEEDVLLKGPDHFGIFDSFSGDPLPHIVKIGEKMYVNDGHHRIAWWQRYGPSKYMAVRVLALVR